MTQPELFAYEVGEPLPGDGAHARAHLLHQNQCDGDGNEGPEGEITPARTRLRIRVDTAGVVINVGGDEPRAEDGQEDHDPRAPGFQHRQVPSFVPQHGDNVVRGDHARARSPVHGATVPRRALAGVIKFCQGTEYNSKNTRRAVGVVSPLWKGRQAWTGWKNQIARYGHRTDAG